MQSLPISFGPVSAGFLPRHQGKVYISRPRQSMLSDKTLFATQSLDDKLTDPWAASTSLHLLSTSSALRKIQGRPDQVGSDDGMSLSRLLPCSCHHCHNNREKRMTNHQPLTHFLRLTLLRQHSSRTQQNEAALHLIDHSEFVPKTALRGPPTMLTMCPAYQPRTLSRSVTFTFRYSPHPRSPAPTNRLHRPKQDRPTTTTTTTTTA